jgi:hypothetical protein
MTWGTFELGEEQRKIIAHLFYLSQRWNSSRDEKHGSDLAHPLTANAPCRLPTHGADSDLHPAILAADIFRLYFVQPFKSGGVIAVKPRR